MLKRKIYYKVLTTAGKTHILHIVLSLLFLFFSFRSFAHKQGQSLIDSLLYELPKAKEDTNKVKLLYSLSFEYRYINAEEGVKYGTQALVLATKNGWQKGIARANNNIGANYSAKSDYPKAMDYYLKALTINEDLNDSEYIAINSVNIGIIYYQQADYKKALDYYLKALALNENLNNNGELSLKKFNETLSKQKEPDTNLVNLKNKLVHNLLEIKKGLAANLVDIGILHSSLKDYPKAMEYYQKALVIDEELDYKDGKGEIFSNIGQDFYDDSNYHEALKYDLKSLSIYQELGNKDGIAGNLGAIGNIYLAIAKNFDGTIKVDSLVPAGKTAILNRAIEYLDKCIAICKETDNLSFLMQFSRDLSDAYALSGDTDKAYTCLVLYTKLRDSVFSDSNKVKIADLEKQREKELNSKLSKLESLKKRNETFVTLGAFVVLMTIIAIVIRNSRRVGKEKQRSDELLLNILPEKVAHELKTTGKSPARYYEPVTVIFTDFVDFTIAAERMTPNQLISELDFCFRTFDDIMGKYEIEKIKTAGDSYMAVSGLPVISPDHAENMVKAAFEIKHFMQERRKMLGNKTFEVRIGIHSGSVVAGIVGLKKFAYDIWGDTVNTAARMEQNSEAGKINISETTYELVKDSFECVYRGEIEAKNKGSMKMYFVVDPK